MLHILLHYFHGYYSLVITKTLIYNMNIIMKTFFVVFFFFAVARIEFIDVVRYFLVATPGV